MEYLQIPDIDIKTKLKQYYLQSFTLNKTKDQNIFVLTQKICVKYVCFQCDFKDITKACMFFLIICSEVSINFI